MTPRLRGNDPRWTCSLLLLLILDDRIAVTEEVTVEPDSCICPTESYLCKAYHVERILFDNSDLSDPFFYDIELTNRLNVTKGGITVYFSDMRLEDNLANLTAELFITDSGTWNESIFMCRASGAADGKTIKICIRGAASSPTGLSVVCDSSSAVVSFQSPVYGGECVEYYVATAVSEERNVSCNVRSGEDSLNCSFSLEGNANDYLFSVYGVTRVNESHVLIGHTTTSDCCILLPENISIVEEECGLVNVSWESSKSESVNRTISWRDSSEATYYERVTGSEDSHQLNFTDTGPVEIAVTFSSIVCNKTVTTNFSSSKCSSFKTPSPTFSPGVTDVTDTTQLNTDADDHTTVIAVSAAVGAGLVAAGLAGLSALTYYWLVKKNWHKHGSSSGGGEELKILRMKSTSSSDPPYTPPPAVPEEPKAPDVVPPLYADLVQVAMEKEQVPAEHMYHVLEGPSPETEQQTEEEESPSTE